MTVYLVQKRHWQFDDDYYVLEDCSPIRAFESRDDAEAFRLEREAEEVRQWQAWEVETRERYGKPLGWFQGEEGVKPPYEYPFFEVVVAELEP